MEKMKKAIGFLMAAITVLYMAGIIWVNFHSRQWINFDVYSDMHLAKIMFEEKTIFPEKWVFGNQYYVVATPVLSALLYAVLHNSFFSMAAASSLMMVFILASFIWCVKPNANRYAVIAGCLVLAGGGILGNNAAAYRRGGFQIFYTLASYYACYLIGILVSLGVWSRLRKSEKCGKFIVLVSILLGFALGMQSVRQTLVLYIPLLLTDVFLFMLEWKKRKRKRDIIRSSSFIYALILALANLSGLLFVRLLNISHHSLLSVSKGDIVSNFRIACKEFFIIIGGEYIQKWTAGEYRAIIAIFIILCVLIAAGMIIKNRVSGPVAWLVVFSYISLFGVFFAGVFIIEIRAIYYFVWFLLAALSFVYLGMYFNKKAAAAVMCMLCAVAAVNFYANFRPAYTQYKKYDSFCREIADYVAELGTDEVLVDNTTSYRGFALPTYLGDEITTVLVRLNAETEDSDKMVKPLRYLQTVEQEEKTGRSYLLLGSATRKKLKKAAEKSLDKKRLFQKLELVKSFQCGEKCYYLYIWDREA